MSRPPYLLLKAREGYRLGNSEVMDALMYDGLTDAYSNKPMGVFADQCASKFGFTRQQQDDFAVESHARARKAVADKVFVDEIAPVSITVRGKTTTVSEDEGLNKFDEAKMRGLRAAFNPDGTVTAGNASSINDGAAALLAGLAGEVPVAGTEAAGPDRRRRDPQPGAGVVHDRADRGRSRNCSTRSAGASPASTCSRSTRPSPSSPWPSARSWACRRRRPTSTAAPCRWAIPIGCSGARLLVTLLTGLKRHRRPARRRRPVRRRRRGDRHGDRDDRLNRPPCQERNRDVIHRNQDQAKLRRGGRPGRRHGHVLDPVAGAVQPGNPGPARGDADRGRPAADPAPLARRRLPQSRRLHAHPDVPGAPEEQPQGGDRPEGHAGPGRRGHGPPVRHAPGQATSPACSSACTAPSRPSSTGCTAIEDRLKAIETKH